MIIPFISVFWMLGGRSISVTSTSFIDYGDDDDFLREVVVNRNSEEARVEVREDSRVSATSCKETIAHPTEAEGNINVLNRDESNVSVTQSGEKVPQMVSYSLLKYKMENSKTFLMNIIVVGRNNIVQSLFVLTYYVASLIKCLNKTMFCWSIKNLK